MSSKKVISFKNLPMKMPVWPTLILLLTVREFGLSGIWIGIIISLLTLVWLGWLIALLTWDTVDLFEDKTK